MRVTLFHNPSAGDARLTADQLQSILREAGYQVRYQSTEKDWRSALDDVGELAVVAGGDGTVAKVAIDAASADSGPGAAFPALLIAAVSRSAITPIRAVTSSAFDGKYR